MPMSFVCDWFQNKTRQRNTNTVGVISFFLCILKVLLLASMFGGVLSVPVNNPHVRKSGSRLVITNLGKQFLIFFFF